MSAAFLWAFDGVVLTPWITDLGMKDVPTFVFMLHATASVFLTYFLVKKRQELKNIGKQDWLAFVLVAIFGGAVGTMAIIAAIIEVYSHGLNISVVLLLQKLQPIFAILLALLWLKEKPRATFYVWAVVALIGSYFLTFGFHKPDFTGQGMFVPAILALGAAFSFGSSTTFSKKALAKVSHGLGTALRFCMTTIVMVLIISVIVVLKASGTHTTYAGFAGFQLLTWEMILAFVIIALTTGGTAIFIYYWGLKRVTATRSTIYELMFPVSAIILEYVFHGKILNPGQWLGAILIIGAILMVTRYTRKPETRSLPDSSGPS
ncbi:MAG: DMT superfamily drug/metabolite permease [Parcubacteria group bacterium GW2011_GWC2_49_9]|nr:MAG: DMT superfamily drug/metabolite permease [Parcubacteria group bacterium GW2011_GWC2_49_9]